VSTVWPVPGFEGEYPAPRYPDLRLRLVPNETLLPRHADKLGELLQDVLDETAGAKVSVEIDTSDRTQRNEGRGGASPVMAIALAVLGGAVTGVTERCFDAVVAWARRIQSRNAPIDDPFLVTLYGPDGEIIKQVQVDKGEAD
jgi:hypothetical protein